MSSLDQYMVSVAPRVEPAPEQSRPQQSSTAPLLQFHPSVPMNLEDSFLVGAGYDGQRRAAYLKLYEPKTHKIHFWYDNTNHTSYCLSKEPIKKLEKIKELVQHYGFLRFEESKKYDALEEKEIPVTIIYARDPLSIGGRTNSIREIKGVNAYEADIHYVLNYFYDRHLDPGMTYSIRQGKLEQGRQLETTQLGEKLAEGNEEYQRLMSRWLRLLEYPVPSYKRISLDIEVESPIETRVPDPNIADDRVICATLLPNDREGRILILRRPKEVEEQETNVRAPGTAEIEWYDREEDLLGEIFRSMYEYPVFITFNGDDFDFRYLYNRAVKLGFPKEHIPIELSRETTGLVYGIHFDLYRFFGIKAIQVYAFGSKYREISLDHISEMILDRGKIPLEGHVTGLSYTDLAAYCYNDAELVLDLTRWDQEVILKIVTALSRINCVPPEDLSRQGVMAWVKSMMYKEHRDRGYIIPRPEDIRKVKGETSTTAIIRGKKYKGGMVVDPVPGVHFNVAVMDFASLYPSIMKYWNLGYETIRCKHTEDKTNRVPDTDHWVCKQRHAMESLLVGSLRDIRVKWYKPKSKDTNLAPASRAWYNIVQNALKVVLNASYGVFGAERFALYCPPVAESTAAIGRYDVTRTIEEAKRLEIEVVYGDTDSIFLKTPNKEKIGELIQWSRKELGMELESDKVYRFVALSQRKKNYLGVQPDGRVDIKGLTGKKRHIPRFLHTAFTQLVEILGQVQSPEDFEEARKKIRTLVMNLYSKLQNHEYSLEELAFNMMMGKAVSAYTKTTPQHIKAAKQLREKGIEVRAGDLVSFVKTKGGVKPVQLANKDEIDIPKYEEYIQSTFEQVLDALELDFAEISGARKSSLETFFTQKE